MQIRDKDGNLYDSEIELYYHEKRMRRKWLGYVIIVILILNIVFLAAFLFGYW